MKERSEVQHELHKYCNCINLAWMNLLKKRIWNKEKKISKEIVGKSRYQEENEKAVVNRYQEKRAPQFLQKRRISSGILDIYSTCRAFSTDSSARRGIWKIVSVSDILILMQGFWYQKQALVFLHVKWLSIEGGQEGGSVREEKRKNKRKKIREIYRT